MKKRRDSDDIPAEIDFSRGVRGKYAERYREGATLRELTPDPVGLHEIQSRLGHALLSAQAFESALVAYLSLVLDLTFSVAAKETRNALELAESSYFDRLFKEWSSHSTTKPPIEKRVEAFLRERNWLVHQSWHHVAPASSAELQREIAHRLEVLADEGMFLGSSLDAIVARKLHEKGLSKAEIIACTRDIIDQWAAA